MDTVADFSESCARRMLRLERDTLLFCTAMVVTSVLSVPDRYQSVIVLFVAYLAVLTARFVELLTILVQLLSKLFEDVNALDVRLSC